MPKKVDITGRVYGKLTVLKWEGHNTHKQRTWLCLCECGNTSVVAGGCLTTGNTKSCGCGEGFRRHGGAGKGSYNTWRAMMRRCYNPKDKDYAKYGAVGVTVQESWHDYLAFAVDMGEPEGAETLHRVDPYGNYAKENCAWASPTVQARVIRVPRRSKTGIIGVHVYNGKYRAQISVGKQKYFGKQRKSIEDAIMDRRELEAKHWAHRVS